MDLFQSITDSGVAMLETLAGDGFSIAGGEYRGNFRTGNSLEQMQAAEAMAQHGYPQKGVVLILHVARSRVAVSAVLSWKRQKLKRHTPTSAEYTVADVNTDDPNVYAVILIGRQ